MSSHREGVNPLRPYYRPPVIGEPVESSATSGANPFHTDNATSSAKYASKARDVLPDIDYKEYLGDSSPSALRGAKEFVDELIWKYTSVLMAQPFEVAKTVLQARNQDDSATLSPTSNNVPAITTPSTSRSESIYGVSNTRLITFGNLLTHCSFTIQIQTATSRRISHRTPRALLPRLITGA